MTFSTLIGLYASREESDGVAKQRLVPANRVATTSRSADGDTYSIFGNGAVALCAGLGAVAGRARTTRKSREQDSFRPAFDAARRRAGRSAAAHDRFVRGRAARVA